MSEEWRQVGAVFGASIAGPPGAVIGGLIGSALDTYVPGVNDIISNILGNLGTDGVKQVYEKGRQYLSAPKTTRINEELLSAFRSAFCAAVYDIGGQSCFPRQSGQEPGVFVFRIVALRARDEALAEQVCVFLQDLSRSTNTLFPSTTDKVASNSVYPHILGNEPLDEQFWTGVMQPFLGGSRLPCDEVEDFVAHLRRHLLPRTLVRLEESIIKSDGIFFAFTKLMLENLHDTLQNFVKDHTSLTKDLQDLVDKIDGISLPDQEIATLFARFGEALSQQQEKRFDQLWKHTLDEHEKTREHDTYEAEKTRTYMSEEVKKLKAYFDIKLNSENEQTMSEDHSFSLPRRAEPFVNHERTKLQALSALKAGRIVLLDGVDGIGKTTLAVEIAENLRSESEQLVSISRSVIYISLHHFRNLDHLLTVIVNDFAPQSKSETLNTAHQVLKRRNSLIILDELNHLHQKWSLDEIESLKYICGRCKLLLVGHDIDLGILGCFGVPEQLPVPEFEDKHAFDFLRLYSPNYTHEQNEIEAICKLVGKKPSDLSLVCNYLNKHQISVGRYLQEWERTVKSQDNVRKNIDIDFKSQDNIFANTVLGVRGDAVARNILRLTLIFDFAPFGHKEIAAALNYTEDDVRKSLDNLVAHGLLRCVQEQYEFSNFRVYKIIRHIYKSSVDRRVIQRLLAYYQVTIATYTDRLLGNAIRHLLEIVKYCQDINLQSLTLGIAETIYVNLGSVWNNIKRPVCEYALKALLAMDQAELNDNKKQENHALQGRWLHRLGNSHIDCGNLVEAIKSYETAQKFSNDPQLNHQIQCDLGSAYVANNESEKAISILEQAQAMGQDIASSQQESHRLNNLGRAYLKIKNIDRALYYLKNAQKLLEHVAGKQKNLEEMINAGYLGDAYSARGDFNEARRHYTRAILTAYEMNDLRGQIKFLIKTGKVCNELGDTQEAGRCWKKAKEIAREELNDEELGRVLQTHKFILEPGSTSEAEKPIPELETILIEKQRKTIIHSLQRALGIAYKNDDSYAQLSALIGLGDKERIKWNIAEAISFYEKALPVAQEFYSEYEGLILRSLGNMYHHVGQPDQALHSYELALIVAEKARDRRNKGVCLNRIGDLHRDFGDKEKAHKKYSEARRIAKEIDNQLGEVDVLNSIGVMFFRLGKYALAQARSEDALEKSKTIKYDLGKIEAFNNLCYIHNEQKNYSLAEDYSQKALEIAKRIHHRRGKCQSLNCLGNVYLNHDLETAKIYYQQSSEIAIEIDDRQIYGVALGNLGTVFRRLGETAKAFECYQQSLTIAQQIRYRRLEAMNLEDLGFMYDFLGDLREAQAQWRQALHIYEEINSPYAENVRKRLPQE